MSFQSHAGTSLLLTLPRKFVGPWLLLANCDATLQPQRYPQSVPSGVLLPGHAGSPGSPLLGLRSQVQDHWLGVDWQKLLVLCSWRLIKTVCRSGTRCRGNENHVQSVFWTPLSVGEIGTGRGVTGELLNSFLVLFQLFYKNGTTGKVDGSPSVHVGQVIGSMWEVWIQGYILFLYL